MGSPSHTVSSNVQFWAIDPTSAQQRGDLYATTALEARAQASRQPLDRYHTPPKEPLSTSKIPYFLPKQSVRKTPMSTDMPVFAPCLLATRRRAWLAYRLSMASEPALTRTRAARAWGGLPTCAPRAFKKKPTLRCRAQT